MKHYGLIGYPLGHSFSQKFFTEKFAQENIDADYQLFPIEQIDLFPTLLAENPNLCGLNVTIPYKEKIIPFLDELDETAREIGAVNVIKLVLPVIAGSTRNPIGQEEQRGLRVKPAMTETQKPAMTELTLKGYNSDVIGFENSLKPLLQPHHKKALILGTGGAAKGVAYILRKLSIHYIIVSRTPKSGQISYADINADLLRDYTLIINTTPIGTFPKTDVCPDIPYKELTNKHLLYDLIYNPEKTLFLQRGEAQGATIKNGLEMLHGQALAAWDIWERG
ncbi:MAG: shikimate dehydrogenase [Prevotellaceae bacterium]|jgi:shikimate dehydrogenase|nr:shikimate dehydrogenase [Prevotellaceae bacterium]